jgi:hypothetical protein
LPATAVTRSTGRHGSAVAAAMWIASTLPIVHATVSTAGPSGFLPPAR